MDNKEFGSIRLPRPLIEELKVWKKAFERSYRATVTYEFMLRSMLDSLEQSEPGVREEFEKLVEEDPSILQNIKIYR